MPKKRYTPPEDIKKLFLVIYGFVDCKEDAFYAPWISLDRREEEDRKLAERIRTTHLSCGWDTRDQLDGTLLEFAFMYGVKHTAKALIDQGASPIFKSRDGDSHALIKAAYYPGNIKHLDPDIELVQLALGLGLDIDATNWIGRTALHYAAQNVIDAAPHKFNGDARREDLTLEIAQLLLEAGANPLAKDHNGLKPWDIARSRIVSWNTEAQKYDVVEETGLRLRALMEPYVQKFQAQAPKTKARIPAVVDLQDPRLDEFEPTLDIEPFATFHGVHPEWNLLWTPLDLQDIHALLRTTGRLKKWTKNLRRGALKRKDKPLVFLRIHSWSVALLGLDEVRVDFDVQDQLAAILSQEDSVFLWQSSSTAGPSVIEWESGKQTAIRTWDDDEDGREEAEYFKGKNIIMPAIDFAAEDEISLTLRIDPRAKDQIQEISAATFKPK